MKKIIKIGITGFLVTIVILSQMNMPIAVAAESAENTGQVADETATEQNVNEVQAQEQVTNESSADQTTSTEQSAVVQSGVLGMVKSGGTFASFAGVNLTGDNTVSFAFSEANAVGKPLDIVASFDGAATITNRQIKIKINEGLGLEQAPGMTGSFTSGSWKFDSSKLPAELKGVITNATYTPDAKVYGYTVKSGTLVYDIAPGTTQVTLSLLVRFDLAFGVFTKSRSFTDRILVETSYTEDGTNKIKNSEKLETYTITDDVGMGIRFYDPSPLRTVSPGDDVSVSYKVIGGYNYYSDTGGYLVEEQTYVFKFDKNIGFQDATVKSGGTADQVTSTVDRTSDPTYDIATVTIKNISANGNPIVNFNFSVKSDAPQGTYNIRASAADSTTKPYGSDIITPNGRNGYVSVGSINVVGAFENKLTLLNTPLRYSDANSDEGAVNNMSLIGLFRTNNAQSQSVTDQLVRFTFNDVNVGVQGMRLPSMIGKNITDITMKTNKGNTYTIASKTAVQAYPGTQTGTVFVSLNEVGVTDNTEYITELTYHLEELPSGYIGSTGTMVLNDNGIYGTVLNIPASRQFSYDFASIDAADGDFNSANAQHATTVTTIDSTMSLAYSSTSTLSSLYAAGTTQKISGQFALVNYTNYVSSKRGFEVYLREGDYLQIDSSTIKISNGSTTYSVADGTLTAIESIDNSGNRVVKLVVNDIKLGYYSETGGSLPVMKIDYEVRVHNTAPTISIPLNELIYVQAIDGTKASNTDSTVKAFNNPNKFNVDGSGDTTKIMGTLANTGTLKIQAQKDFTVTSAANLNGGAWVSYDYATNKSIIDLNPSGDAKYQLTVANNSGNTIDGYTALIPIPKAGEKTDLTPATPAQFDPSVHLQKDAFTWTASINQEIVPGGSLDYTVLYATSYATDKDSAAFVPWSAIANKDDIRMVKVTTNTPIPDGFNEAFSFPLVLSDANADANAGKTNIYSARIHRVISGTAGYKPSEPIAIRLKTGVVKGQVFNDTNRNGLKDAGETGRNGVTVIAYQAGTNTLLETTTSKTIDGIDGSYAFLGLDKNQKVDVVFINPSIDGSLHFSPLTAGGSMATPSATQDKATVAAFTPSGTDYDKVNAGIITPTVITLNAAGGSTATPTINKYPGEQITAQPDAVKTGYTFNGWFTAATGGSKIAFPYTAGTTDVTLYAQYTVDSYVASFDIAANSGEGTKPSDQTVNFGAKITQPANAVKTGYTFNGWFTAATGGTQWNFATGTMPAANQTLYAQFTINNYTMTFNNDGATTTQSVVYGAIATEPTAPSKSGYTFNGWYTASSGGTKWDFTTTTMPANNVTLYAQYTVNSFVASFDIATNGGEGTKPANETVNFGAKITQPADAIKTGATFTGWFDAATGGNKWNFATDTMPAANKTLYAQFSTNAYVVTFNNEGATTTQNVAYAAKITEPTAPSKIGYTFTGWFDATTGGNKWNFTTGTMPAANMTLYAQYVINNYTVTFNNGGVITTANVAYDAAITEPAAPSKAGYTFVGWFDAASGGVKWDFATGKMPAQNLTLYARLSADDQTISFDANGGSGAPATMTQPTDSAVNLDAVTVPTRSGYTFVGWFDTADVQYSGTFNMPVGGLVLKAKWTADDQVISFNTKGGSGVNSMTAKTDATVDLDTAITTRAGYQFDGWFVGGVEYSGTITVPVGGLALEAHWTALNQTITFDVNGGKSSTAPVSIIAPTDASIDLSTVAAPSRFGYEFIGWADASGVIYSGTITMPANGLTLVAQWKDLIVDGIWKINAKDVRFTVSEVKQFIAAGTFEQEILARSEAKAWDDRSGDVLTPLVINNLDAMLAAANSGAYPTAISYNDPNPDTVAATAMATNSSLSSTINVYVDEDPVPEDNASGLPVTGQNDLVLPLGLLAIIISAVTIFFTGKKRRQEK